MIMFYSSVWLRFALLATFCLVGYVLPCWLRFAFLATFCLLGYVLPSWLRFTSSSSPYAGARIWPPHSPSWRTLVSAPGNRNAAGWLACGVYLVSGATGCSSARGSLALSSWEPVGGRWESKNTPATRGGGSSSRFPSCALARNPPKWAESTNLACPFPAPGWPPPRGPRCDRGTRP